MSRDQTSSEDRLQKLRLILRTMEEAVDDAKIRRTSDGEPLPESSSAAPSPTLSSPSVQVSDDRSAPPAGLHGRGRDIPGPDSLPRAKARPKGFQSYSDGGSQLGRTG
jgi:hypothetical protein